MNQELLNNPKIKAKYVYAFFSEEAKEQFGTHFRVTSTGRKVEVTAVYESIEDGNNHYLWEDKYFAGVVFRNIK